MAQEQVKQFLEQATQSIQSNRFAEANELLDQALAIEPDNADANLLKGIALSQTSQPMEASDAFRRSIQAAPGNAKAHFNFAVHLYAQGQKQEALAEARQALEVEPQHSGARDLATRLETELGQIPYSRPPETSAGPGPSAMPPPGYTPPQQGYVPPVGQPYYQQGYERQSIHSLGFVEKLGNKWVAIGWTLAAMSLLGLILNMMMILPMMSEIMASASRNSSAGPDQMAMQRGMMGNPMYIPAQIAGYGSLLGIIGWTIADIIDRRGNFVWLLLQVPLSCCGLGWLSTTIYILAGRK